MKAIVSDIHGNLEALQAVLKDIAAHGVKEIVCLGDVIGYGPNPRECLDLAMEWKLTIKGNHDEAAVFDPRDFNPVALKATYWTRRQLEAPVRSRQAADRRWEFLAEMPTTHQDGDLQYVHGSARNPLNEYVFPEDVYNARKIDSIFARVSSYCFQGHTHVPGIFTEDRQFFSPDEIDFTYTLRDRKVLCNVGSVGQPRDGDSRACYVLLDGRVIRFRRVEYDVESTVKKICAVPDLDRFLAERLRKGK